MIISASRRTDIPAFYTEWFLRRLREGFVRVVNPFNTRQVSEISLRREDVTCLVFWTKNAAPLLARLGELEETGIPFYFQFTVTPYGRDIEPGLPEKAAVVRTFQRLAARIGRGRTVWRYDPILLTEKYSVAWHSEQFRNLLAVLAPCTDTCVLSFLDLYAKTERNTRTLGLLPLGEEEMRALAAGFSEAARGSGVVLKSCAEAIDLVPYGIAHGACIDRTRLEKILGGRLAIQKDPTQRGACQCVKSVDIGAYNTCGHLCRYCYANFNAQMARALLAAHDPAAPSLTRPSPGAKVTYPKGDRVTVKKDAEFEEGTLFS